MNRTLKKLLIIVWLCTCQILLFYNFLLSICQETKMHKCMTQEGKQMF